MAGLFALRYSELAMAIPDRMIHVADKPRHEGPLTQSPGRNQ
jgi:hypothetical protein